MNEPLNCFAPVADNHSHLVILGTMPSVKSLANGFYYAHARNAFWPILADLVHAPTPQTTVEKRELLLKNGIALWDVLSSCIRPGSLDSAIRNAVPNDFDRFFKQYPQIRAIAFNGSQAYRIFYKHCAHILADRIVIALPSTSPAYTLPYPEKLRLWKQALSEFGG